MEDGQVCADHDRSEGEGVGPQEYTLIKLKLLAPFPASLKAVEGRDVFLAPATLRPETMYGQTNCFVLPDGQYGAYEISGGDVLVMSARAARGLAHQVMDANTPRQHFFAAGGEADWGNAKQLAACSGHDLIGCALAAPHAAYEKVYVLPLLTISMGKGTGVVTSVPSDAPDDYVALQELKDKPEFRKKFGLTDEMVMPFEVVPIINIPEFGDASAVFMCEKLGIKTQGEKDKLALAKDETYLKGFTSGVMLVGAHKGKKVSEAKPLIRAEMIAAGTALPYFEPEKMVKSRTNDECVVGFTDQWYLSYGEPEWCDAVRAHVNDPSRFNAYFEENLSRFNQILGWLKEWACSRLFGLGTRVPWDDMWVIESLSDSTIYMAYYTIAHKLQGLDNIEGRATGPSGIAAEQLSDAVFDYIYLRGPKPPAGDAGADIALATLDELRAEFEYWCERERARARALSPSLARDPRARAPLTTTECLSRPRKVPDGPARLREGPYRQPPHDGALQPRRRVEASPRDVAARLLLQRPRAARWREDVQELGQLPHDARGAQTARARNSRGRRALRCRRRAAAAARRAPSPPLLGAPPAAPPCGLGS